MRELYRKLGLIVLLLSTILFILLLLEINLNKVWPRYDAVSLKVYYICTLIILFIYSIAFFLLGMSFFKRKVLLFLAVSLLVHYTVLTFFIIQIHYKNHHYMTENLILFKISYGCLPLISLGIIVPFMKRTSFNLKYIIISILLVGTIPFLILEIYSWYATPLDNFLLSTSLLAYSVTLLFSVMVELRRTLFLKK